MGHKFEQILKENNMPDDLTKIIVEEFDKEVEKKAKEKKKEKEPDDDDDFNKKMKDKEKEIKEKYEKEMEDRVAAGLIELEEKISGFIDHVIDEFTDETLKLTESVTKVELAASLTESVMKVFKENGITISPDQKDLVAEKEIEIAKLGKTLNESMKSVSEMKKELEQTKKTLIIKEMCGKEMSDTQIEKVSELLESVFVTDMDEFKEKVSKTISIVSEKKVDKKEKDDDGVINESFKGVKTELDEFLPPSDF